MTARGPRVAVLDYGAANLVSIGQGLAAAGAEVSVATDPAGREVRYRAGLHFTDPPAAGGTRLHALLTGDTTRNGKPGTVTAGRPA